MRILIVHPQMALYAGAEIVVARLAHYLQKHGHGVSILTLSTAPHPDYAGLHFILPAKESERIEYRLRDGAHGTLWDVYRMFTLLKRSCIEVCDDFDVINAHNFPAIWAAPRGKRIVWMCNEVPDLWHSARTTGLANKMFDIGRLADRVVVRSKSPTAVVPDDKCAEIFEHRYSLTPTIIPYGIDSAFFTQTVRNPHGKFNVIQPSMISPSKNQLEVLKALRGMDTRVILAGYLEPSHSYTRLLQRYALDYGIDATFTGQISRRILRALYSEAHVAVFAGKGQGSWLGPFEALSAGCPVIVSPNLSCSELIAKNGLGIVTSNLTDALRRVQHKYSKYQQQALRGRGFVTNHLTWDRFGESMMRLMEK